MGLVDTALENASFDNIALVGGVCVGLYYVWALIDEHVRIKRLGNYGPTLYHYLPFGI